MGKHTQPKALKEIYEAIESLEKQGIKPTISEVAKSLGKAYDTINGTLNYHKQKDLLTKLRTYQEYPKQNRSDKQAIHRVREAIAELNAKGTKTTTASVGSHLGISKQRVHQILKEFNELSSLDNFQQRDELERISKELKNFDTKGLLPSEIKKFPIDGIANLNVSQMSKLLCKYKIPHANNIIDKIKLIDNTEQYTAQELHKIVGGNFRRLREVLYAEKIPFKNGRRNRDTVATILQRISEIDTSKYTSRELYKLLKMDGSLEAFYNLLRSHKIKCARIRNKDTVATILQRISEIDTSKYNISSLARMIGTTRQTLSKIVAEHNIPVFRNRCSKDEFAQPACKKQDSIQESQTWTQEKIRQSSNNNYKEEIWQKTHNKTLRK
ncbi:hypothetical protein JAO10_09240 [Burkholderia contaminans]|uniref:hypothetical protein n=1 Tax=Burkholderia contaminans TaxID=488447 RepID=UPI0018DB1FF1|nr:hypothetical protein [Burkholderia contaminans]MBH9720516.1 hypothetical protein [Burkholderia contaminans]